MHRLGAVRVPRGTLETISAASVVLAAILGASELIHARAARRGITNRAGVPADRPGVVVVLGFANRGTRINMVNRWRARVAVRSVRRRPAARVICSGGAVRGTTAEGDLLARYLREGLGWSGPIGVERKSRSTWENVANVVPLLGDAEWLVFASGSLHAEKARTYLRRQRPDLVRLMVPGSDHRWGEMTVVKPLFAAVGLWKLARLRRST
ncbi:ElyC/SanA/YdcF family protein [Curtobacterium luteum]|uniref:ElyC/SanA/YdcF family protein n=1 Tax=Curtobacterium luteum TaxID=33881 RepID=UPI001584F520|nr:ElyC/SanA/YdcF family protein [Curtobacterium luteum]NUU51678.1 DUF218 domain-containing protein [Curtobacterium luteum]